MQLQKKIQGTDPYIYKALTDVFLVNITLYDTKQHIQLENFLQRLSSVHFFRYK